MFICESCHEQFEGWHVKTTSHGPCEVCGITKYCYDCKHHRISKKSDVAKTQTLEDAVALLRSLSAFAQHETSCDHKFNNHYGCSCGLDRMGAAIDAFLALPSPADSAPRDRQSGWEYATRIYHDMVHATTVENCDKPFCLARDALNATPAPAPPTEALRTFPMLDGPSIPWSLAETIYAKYSERYGDGQSLERIAERGGFGWSEVPALWKRRRRGGFGTSEEGT